MVATVATWVAGKATALVAGATGSLAVAQTVYAAAYFGTQLAITAGLSLAAQRLAQASTPDIETAKASLKQTIPPRIHGYGYRRLGGSFLLWEAKNNYAYDVVAVHHGRIASVDEIWLHDKKLNFVGGGVGGWVAKSAEYGGGDSDLIHVEYRLGAATETPYGAIVSALSSGGTWTSACRGDGIATLGADYHHAKKENLLKDFPNGGLLQWSMVGWLSPVWDPRDPGQSRTDPSTWTATGNLARQILDFCWNAPGGMRMDYEAEIEPLLAGWIEEMDICDEAIPLKDGGTEPRYHGGGFHALAADPQDFLDKMLAACDGRLCRDEFGVWRLWVGKVRIPTVYLTDEDIADYDIQGDASAFDVVNEIAPTFVSAAHGWTMVEATPWRVTEDVTARGQPFSTPMPLDCVDSASHARRLAKREALRQLAETRGTLVGRLSAARAMGQRWIGLDLADLGYEAAVVEIQKGARTSFARSAVDLPFSLVDFAVDDWDPDTEEDGSGTAPPRPGAGELAVPGIASAAPFWGALAGGYGARLRIQATGPARDDLTWLARWRVTGGDSWNTGQYPDIDPGADIIMETAFVPTETLVECQVAYVTGGGVQSAWGPAVPVEVNTSTASLAPDRPSSLDAYINDDTIPDAVVLCSAPTSANVVDIVFYKGGATDDFDDAIALAPVAATPGALIQVEVTNPPGGVYRFWAVARNGAGTPSAPAGPVEVTVP